MLIGYILSIVCLKLNRFSHLSFTQYVGLYPGAVYIHLTHFSCGDCENTCRLLHLIKSSRYTGGDFMFLYRFVRRRRRRPQILVHAITFEQLFGFLSFLARLLALTFKLPDYILGDLDLDLDLDFQCQIFICYISAKNGPIATKRTANISIELQGSNVTIGFDLGHDLDLEYSRSNIEFAISQPKVVRLPLNEKQTYRSNSKPQMWPMGLTLTITLTFEFCRSNMTLTFDHTHDLDHGSSWSNFEIAVSQNGRADWHFTKGVAVGHSWPWPFGDLGQMYGSTR